jgi:hypothetical protein
MKKTLRGVNMKKFAAVLLVLGICGTALFAQESVSNWPKNSVVGGPNIGILTFGMDLEYERIVLENFLDKGTLAVAAETGITTVVVFPIFYIDARVRWYPWSHDAQMYSWARNLFADLGLGFASFLGVAPAF